MADFYASFSDLRRSEALGRDYAIEAIDRESPYAVIAIHGGNIEPATTEIARAVAGEDCSFYSFIGMKPAMNSRLHITSRAFDEPGCLALVARSERAVSIHGMAGQGESVMVGGLDDGLKLRARAALAACGYETREPPAAVNGDSPLNICNRCKSGRGLQLELGRGLRDRLAADPAELARFASAVRSAL